MKIIKMGGWIFYRSDTADDTLKHDKCGKWMHFFDSKDNDYITEICHNAVENNIVVVSKHTDDTKGVACFYLNCDDVAGHKRIIEYFIKNNLIAKTKTNRLYNISFKLDDQTRNGEYGKDFKSDIKLEQFIDLDTGEWLII